MIAPSDKSRPVRCGDQPVDLCVGEERDKSAFEPLRWDGKDTLYEAACSGWRSAANRNSEWMAASLALRVRGSLPRSVSR